MLGWLFLGLPGDELLQHLLVAVDLQVVQREAAPDEEEQLLGRARGRSGGGCSVVREGCGPGAGAVQRKESGAALGGVRGSGWWRPRAARPPGCSRRCRETRPRRRSRRPPTSAARRLRRAGRRRCAPAPRAPGAGQRPRHSPATHRRSTTSSTRAPRRPRAAHSAAARSTPCTRPAVLRARGTSAASLAGEASAGPAATIAAHQRWPVPRCCTRSNTSTRGRTAPARQGRARRQPHSGTRPTARRSVAAGRNSQDSLSHRLPFTQVQRPHPILSRAVSCGRTGSLPQEVMTRLGAAARRICSGNHSAVEVLRCCDGKGVPNSLPGADAVGRHEDLAQGLHLPASIGDSCPRPYPPYASAALEGSRRRLGRGQQKRGRCRVSLPAPSGAVRRSRHSPFWGWRRPESGSGLRCTRLRRPRSRSAPRQPLPHLPHRAWWCAPGRAGRR